MRKRNRLLDWLEEQPAWPTLSLSYNTRRDVAALLVVYMYKWLPKGIPHAAATSGSLLLLFEPRRKKSNYSLCQNLAVLATFYSSYHSPHRHTYTDIHTITHLLYCTHTHTRHTTIYVQYTYNLLVCVKWYPPDPVRSKNAGGSECSIPTYSTSQRCPLKRQQHAFSLGQYPVGRLEITYHRIPTLLRPGT